MASTAAARKPPAGYARQVTDNTGRTRWVDSLLVTEWMTRHTPAPDLAWLIDIDGEAFRIDPCRLLNGGPDA